MQAGESVATPTLGPDETPVDTTDKTPLNVRCIMLFDGTMNNKTNIQSREDRDEFYQATRKKKFRLFGERVGPGGDSYENGYTNIVTLDKHIEDQPAHGYDLVVKVYTEGAGTLNHEKDATMGYAMGLGDAGVKSKCHKGIVEALSEITNRRVNGAPINPEKQYIKKLTVDVFGFSRGAATARYCIHKVLVDNTWRMQRRLRAQGIEVQEVEVHFAGIFDTVSSHGIKFSDDVRGLELDAVKHARKVLHLAAGEEYRENFSLTTIQSAGGNGEEWYLPGVHSDVGGSYLEETDEDFYLVVGSFHDVDKDRKELIAEGWYKQGELKLETIKDSTGMEAYSRLKAVRKGISNAYCNIPLKLMAESARAQNILIKAELEAEANDAVSSADAKYGSRLTELDANIGKYRASSMEAFSKLVKEPLLVEIRHRYFHMSAKDSIGLKPRFRNDPVLGRVRRRQIYEG